MYVCELWSVYSGFSCNSDTKVSNAKQTTDKRFDVLMDVQLSRYFACLLSLVDLRGRFAIVG